MILKIPNIETKLHSVSRLVRVQGDNIKNIVLKRIRKTN